MKNTLFKKGSSFVEVLAAVIFLSMLSLVIFNTSRLHVIDTKSMIQYETNILLNSYINKTKIECKKVTGDLAVLNFPIIESNLPFMKNGKYTVKYSCYMDTANTIKNTHLYNINVILSYTVEGETRSRNATSFIYK